MELDCKMATKFKTRYNYKPGKGEKHIEPSLVVPERGVANIADVIKSFTQGVPLSIPSQNANPVYNPDFTYRDLDHYDLADIELMRKENQRKIDNLKSDENILQQKKAELDKAVNEHKKTANKSAEPDGDS